MNRPEATMRSQHFVIALLTAVPAMLACDDRSGIGADGRDATADPGAFAQENGDWPAYGRDAGGSRYSPLRQIDRTNVGRLELAWTYRTGDLSHDDGTQGDMSGCGRCHRGEYKFEATPLHADGRLYLSTPLNRVVALDPATGGEFWRFDPHLALDIDRNEGFVSRGVALWRDGTAGQPCATRVFIGTVDARLFALDAATGTPCADFGEAGVVALDRGVGNVQVGQYGMTSPPVIVGDQVIVGSSMGDNRRVDMERGIVRAFDVRTGEQRWAWDPIPRSAADAAYREWTADAAAKTGAGNAWAPLSADPQRDLVFVPTGSAAPDFYGGERPGDNRHANSVVALRASTGDLVWEFQVVHHDLWDYDVAAQPTLLTVPTDGRDVPAVAVGTKMGLLFLLDRETGEPLFPVEERAVPSSDVPGEVASPTQPFPVAPAPLHPHTIDVDRPFALNDADRTACLETVRGMRNEGIYTPPSANGTVLYPGFGGGINWGGLAVDPTNDIVVATVMRVAMWVRLVPRPAGETWGTQLGTPYHMTRGPWVAPSGVPCSPPPWSMLAGVDLASGNMVWQVPLGSPPGMENSPGADSLGSAIAGGPMITAGGLVFIGASADAHLRAFDVMTGRELWKEPLPAGGQATPMTYMAGDTQYVVIAAGGHSTAGAPLGDFVVAYRLRR